MTRSVAVTVRRPGASRAPAHQHRHVAPDRRGEANRKRPQPLGQHLGRLAGMTHAFL